MSPPHARPFSWRRLLGGVTLVGMAGLLSLHPRSAAAEPPPETTTLRLASHSRSLCQAPLDVAQELLPGEGCTDVQDVKIGGVERALASGQVGLVTHFCGPRTIQVDEGGPIVLLAGRHPGGVELFGAAESCAREPERAARFLVGQGDAPRYDAALRAVQETAMAYGRWREYDPEDTMCFYALRLRAAGMSKSTPQKLIAQGTDWRFLKALKNELK